MIQWEDIFQDKNATNPELKIDETALASIIYTSGSTGKPKGVMLSHGAILHNCNGAKDALLELGLANEVFLSFLPLIISAVG